MLELTECFISADGLKNPAAQVMVPDFEFIVGEKRYPCSSFFAEFLSPAVAEMHIKDPSIKEFKIDVEDPDNYFELLLQLMKGSEIEADIKQSVFLTKVGRIIKNDEIVEAFSLLRNKKLNKENAIPTFLEKKEFHQDVSAEIEYIARHFYTFNSTELSKLDIDTLKELFSHDQLMIYSEDSLYQFITSLIDERGDEFKDLLCYVKYENLSPQSSQTFHKYITPSLIHRNPLLWDALKERILLPTELIRLPNRYIHKEILIPFDKDQFDGIFSYITKSIGGSNPVDAEQIEVTVCKEECTVSPASLMNYRQPASRWYLAEHEDNWVCFDFKKARVAIDGYTISSGSESSYWEYPVSFTWEGSADKKKWVEIDVKDHNEEMGGNEKTHTWKLKKISPLFRYIRFRLRNVTRRGGLYTPRIELFGAYEPPDDMKATLLSSEKLKTKKG